MSLDFQHMTRQEYAELLAGFGLGPSWVARMLEPSEDGMPQDPIGPFQDAGHAIYCWQEWDKTREGHIFWQHTAKLAMNDCLCISYEDAFEAFTKG